MLDQAAMAWVYECLASAACDSFGALATKSLAHFCCPEDIPVHVNGRPEKLQIPGPLRPKKADIRWV